MKKLLIVALALAIGIVLAVPAMAETDFKFEGNFYTWIYSLSNVTAIKADNDHNRTTNFMWMKAKFRFRAFVSKTLYFQGTFVGLDKPWGRNYQYPDQAAYLPITTGSPVYKMNQAVWREATINWVSPVGFFRVGQYRTDPDPIMGKLGVSPVSADRYYMASDRDVARIIYAGTFVPYHTLILLYEKVYETDLAVTNTFTRGPQTLVYPQPNWDYDHDYDVYYMRNDFRWKGGEIRVVTEWDRFQTYGGTGAAGYEIVGNKYIFMADVLQEFGPFSIWLNTRDYFGALDYLSFPTGTQLPGAFNAPDGRHFRMFSYAGTVDYKQGPIQAGVGYYHTPGQQRNDDDTLDKDADITTGLGTLDWFMPLYAAFGQYDGLLWNYTLDWSGFGIDATRKFVASNTMDPFLQGLNLFLAWFDYQVLENVWLHTSFGYMARDIQFANFSKYYGSEIDFGAAWTLVKGLSLEFHFGYFSPGDNIKDMYVFFHPGSDPDVAPHIHTDLMFWLRF